MRHLINLVGALLGLAFVAFGCMYLFDMMPKQDPPPEGSAIAHFMAAFGATGWMTMVKVCELIGGVLTAIPRTRCLGLLLLGPVLVNIVAFHFFAAGDGLTDPILVALVAMAGFLLIAEWRAFAFLVQRPLPGATRS